MFTINLKEELENIPPSKTKEEREEDLLLSEAIHVLEHSANNDLQIYARLGWKDMIDQGLKIQKDQAIYAKKISNLDQSKIFTMTQIKKLCIKYRLRFLPSSYYKGKIDPQVPSIIRAYENKSEDKVHQYFIAAPKKSFKLQERPVDPLLFVSLGMNRFYLLHKWGNDLNPLRRLLGLLTSNSVYFLVAISCLIGVLAVYPEGNLLGIVSICHCILAVVIFAANDIDHFLSEKIWDDTRR